MTPSARGLILGTIAVTALACSAGGIAWEETVDEAMRRSALDGRPVLLYFTYHG